MQKTEKEKIIEIIQNEDIGEYTSYDFKDFKYNRIFEILKPLEPAEQELHDANVKKMTTNGGKCPDCGTKLRFRFLKDLQLHVVCDMCVDKDTLLNPDD